MKRLFLPFMMLLLAITGTVRADELTVHDGSETNSYVPVYGFYADAYLKCEMVYPAEELSVMSGGQISSLTFGITTPATETWTATFQVFVKEVDGATISAFSGTDGATIVYTGTLDGTGSTMTVNFDAPYTYNGGNLLVGFYLTTTGNYKSITWVGESVDGASVQGYNYSDLDGVNPTQRNFLPATTFNYTAGGQGGDEPQDIPNEYFYISASGWAIWAAAPESYPEEPTCEIEEIEITGFTVPVYGNAIDTELETGADNYSITTAQWYDNASYNPMEEGETFDIGTTYYMLIQVAIDDECTLADGYTVTINGSDAAIDPTYTSFSDGVLTLMTIDYDVEEGGDECVIDLVEVYGFEAPVFGGVASTAGLYVNSDQYEISYAEWSTYTTSLVEGETFGEDTYYLYVELTPSADCEIGATVSYNFNGEAGTADEDYCGYDSDYDVFYVNSVDYELTDPGDDPQPTADVIDFETGDFSQADFSIATSNPWEVTSDDNHTDGGTYCMKSGNGGVDSSTSEMILEVNIEETKAISFWAKISSEANYDKGYFSIDGANKISGISGSGSWINYSYKLEAGTHSLRWYYTKDSSTSGNDDCFYVDDIEIVEYVPEPLFPITFESGEIPDEVIVINNDGDNKAFEISSSGAYEGNYCASVGYNGSGNDDWLIFPVTPEAGQSVSLYAKSGGSYYLESFEIAVSTTTPEVASFTTVLGTFVDIPDSYNEYTADLSAYAGQDIYVAIHCISVDKLRLYVDNIDIVSAKKAIAKKGFKNLSGKQAIAHNGKKHEVMKAIKANSRIEFIAPNFWGAKGNRDGEDMFVSYNLYLDGNLVAEGITDLDYYMQEAENFTDGSSHIAKIEAVYESGATLDMTKAWTFQSGDHFTGAPEGLAVNVEGTTANLSWELPEAGLGVTDLFYDFEDGSLGDLTSLNANNDNKYWIATMSYPNYTYEGSGMAMVSYAAPNDDYLITPQIRPTEGSVFSFYANNDGGSLYPETFEVMVSTTGMEAADFTPITDMITISGGYQLFEYGLGDYAGQDIYLAIHNVSDDMDVMFVDNMSITSVEAELSHVGAVVYRDGEIVAKLRNGETSYTEELEGSDIPTYCISIIQNGSKDAGVYYALAEKQCVEQVVVACQAPYDLAAVADGSDVTLTWNMDGEKSVLLFDDFEDGALTNWTTIDADGDGETWENATPAAYGIGEAYSGTNCASSWSWNSYALYPDNYMISPLVEGATSLHYYVATNSAYPDHYGVYASTTGIDTTDFVLLLEETAGNSKGGVEGAVRSSKTQPGTRAMSSWIEKTITLPAGTKYVAFRHWNSDDKNYLFIDDVTIYGEDIPSTATYNIYSSTDGENYTILAAGVEGTTYTDEDLEPGTYYYQVTANNVVATGDCESEPALAENGDDNFVMVEVTGAYTCYAPINLDAALTDNDITLTWEMTPGVAQGSIFNIYRSLDGETYEPIAEGVTEMTYIDEDLDYGTYYYQVTAVNILPDQTECESDPAMDIDEENDFVMVEIEEPEPEECVVPINLDATVNGSDVTVTWEVPGQGGGDEDTFTYGFEEDLEGWTTFYGDDAESSWLHSSENPGGYDYTEIAHEGTGFAMSYSFIDYDGEYQADNYLVSPVKYALEAGAQMTFFYDFGNDSYPDYFTVEVSTGSNNTASDFSQVWNSGSKSGNSNHATVRRVTGTRYENWRQATIDLSAYAGQEVWIAFHHTDYDAYELWIDDVTISTSATREGGLTYNIYRSEDGVDYELIAEGVTDQTYVDEDLEEGTYYYQVVAIGTLTDGTPCEEYAIATNGDDDFVMVEVEEQEPEECVAPINLAATLDGNDVTVTWSMEGGDETVIFFDDFEDGALANWTTIDADGDGDSWVNATPASYGIGNAYSGTNCASSWSWNNASYDPDNYMISPLVEGATKVTYFVATNTAYPDHYGVYASTTGTNASDFTLLFEETAGSKGAQGGVKSSMTQPGDRALSAWMEKTVTLPAGTKYVAFRHYDSYDKNYLFIDDVTIYAEEAPEGVTFNVYRSTDGEEYEIVAEGVTDMSYFDEDLEAGTYYYQVTAINTLSDGTTCESEYALAVNDEDDYVMVEIEEPQECVAPIDLLATVEAGNVVLVWDMNADVIINGFRIYRSTDGENYDVIATVTETTYTDEGLGDGTYYYQVTALNALAGGECESEPAMDVNNQYNYVEIVLEGIADINNLINVYPNPTKGNVNIEAEGLSNIVVFNALGQVVYEVNATDDHVVVNMSNFGAGVYMFNIITNNGTTVKRVTVAK